MSKSDGVFEVVDWIRGKIKAQKLIVEADRKSERAMGMFEDCGEYYRIKLVESTTELNTLIAMKIGIEKYAKKLRHQEREDSDEE